MVRQDKRKCFTVEQPRDTPIVFAYEIMDENHVVDFSLFYGEMGLKELQIMNISLHKAIGHVDFTADNSGYYSVCVQQHPLAGVNHPTVSFLFLLIVCGASHMDQCSNFSLLASLAYRHTCTVALRIVYKLRL